MEMLTTIAALGLVKLEAFAIALLDFGTLAEPSRGNRRSRSLVETEVKTIVANDFFLTYAQARVELD